VAATPDVSGTSTLVPAATTVVTPTDTAVTPADTAGASPTTAALADTATIGAPAPATTVAPADTAAPTAAPAAPGRRGRPTTLPGSGTVTAPPPVPQGIVRHTPGITQTTVLTPTGLLQAMALHLRRHGHAHGKGQRQQPAAPPAVVQLAFVGANPTPRVAGLDPLAGTVTYLHGTNRRMWTTHAPTYGRVAYQNLYPSIDLAFHGRQGALEYDWLLAPRAAVGRIRLAVRGAGTLRLDGQGNLLLRTAAGTLRQARPVAYQQVGVTRRPVAARYVLRAGHEVGLAVGAYDHTRPLVIDPVLSYATYLGGSDVDQVASIAVDGSGYVYVSGDTVSTNFPTVNPAQASFTGGVSYGDIFVMIEH